MTSQASVRGMQDEGGCYQIITMLQWDGHVKTVIPAAVDQLCKTKQNKNWDVVSSRCMYGMGSADRKENNVHKTEININ